MSLVSGVSRTSAPIARLTALAAVAFVCTRAILDPDLWWHIRVGLDLLDVHRLPSHDPYSFTQDVPWVNHEWLSEVIMAVAYRAAGVPGLLLMKGLLVVAIFAVLGLALRRTEEPARWWVLAACAVSLNFSSVTIRPQLWTLLGVAVLLSSVADGATRERRYLLTSRRALFAIPVLFALWANLHGGWIVGLAIAGLWTVGRFLDTRSIRETAAALLALSLGFLATAINPYGWKLWTFLLATVRLTRDLTEWHPVWQQEGATEIVTWVVVSIGIVGPILMWRRRALTWAAALPIAWLAIMSLLVARVLSLYGEVALLGFAQAWLPRAEPADRPFTPTFDSTRSSVGGFDNSRHFSRANKVVVEAVLVVAIAVANLVPESRCLTTDGSWVPDYETAGVLTASHAEGHLALPYDWGGFAIWHWGPRLKVSVDPRRETVYSETVLATQTAVEMGRPEGMEFLDRERPEYVWLPALATGTEAWLRGNGYRIDVETGRSFIGTRADLPALSAGPAHPGCFP